MDYSETAVKQYLMDCKGYTEKDLIRFYPHEYKALIYTPEDALELMKYSK